MTYAFREEWLKETQKVSELGIQLAEMVFCAPYTQCYGQLAAAWTMPNALRSCDMGCQPEDVVSAVELRTWQSYRGEVTGGLCGWRRVFRIRRLLAKIRWAVFDFKAGNRTRGLCHFDDVAIR